MIRSVLSHRWMSRCATIFAAGALLLGADVLAGGAAARAQSRDQLYEAYLAELLRPDAQYVALGLHFRHDDDCTNRGCVLMGPTDDRDACEEWVKHYNRIDPYDAARCFEATPFLDR